LLRFPSTKYSILINTNARTLTLYKNRKIYKTYPAAVGKPSTPTPKGNFRVVNKAFNPGGPFGARWLGYPYLAMVFMEPIILHLLEKLCQMDALGYIILMLLNIYNLVPLGTPVKIIISYLIRNILVVH
jgi:hypothetical protein